MTTQPEALRLANALDIEFDRDAVISEYDIKGAAAKLRQLQGEVESMKAERLHTERELHHLRAVETKSELRRTALLDEQRKSKKLRALNAKLLEALRSIRYECPTLSAAKLRAMMALDIAKVENQP